MPQERGCYSAGRAWEGTGRCTLKGAELLEEAAELRRGARDRVFASKFSCDSRQAGEARNRRLDFLLASARIHPEQDHFVSKMAMLCVDGLDGSRPLL